MLKKAEELRLLSIKQEKREKEIKEQNENNNKDKIEFINICNTVENKNNPIKFKLYKKNILQNNSNINSLQIKNKNEFLSSFNSPKERMYRTNIGLDLINMDENIVKYQKKSLKRILNIKTKANSEVELIIRIISELFSWFFQETLHRINYICPVFHPIIDIMVIYIIIFTNTSAAFQSIISLFLLKQ